MIVAEKALDVLRVCLLGLLFAFGLAACSADTPVAEADYPAKLVGEWIGTVGDTKESMKFNADKTFEAWVRPTGFISNTLGQGVTGTIRGTWTIAGRVVTLNVDSATYERVVNRVTTSTIESFKTNELVVKSGIGTVTTFTRAL
ncbi:MAG: hypothetical protein AB7S93_09260 [Xanthobacteraceae bacterium]